MRRLLAALASFMFVTAVVAVAAPPRAAALDGVPRIVVHPDEDSVVAEGMAPGAAITITRGDPPAVIAEGLLEMTDEGDVRFQSPEDIQAGDVVTVKDGSVTRIHAVTALAVGAISGNTVTGNATPGLVDFWLNGADPGVNRQVTSMDGTWSINVGEPGNEDWEQGLAELGPGASGAVEQKDDDGDSTHVDWRIPNPWITASVGDTGISGNDFVPGAIVTVSLNDAIIGTATVEAWSDFTLRARERWRSATGSWPRPMRGWPRSWSSPAYRSSRSPTTWSAGRGPWGPTSTSGSAPTTPSSIAT